jgi:hypothetical protein
MVEMDLIKVGRNKFLPRSSFDQDEADPKVLKKRLDVVLAKATGLQLKQIYGHVR